MLTKTQAIRLSRPSGRTARPLTTGRRVALGAAGVLGLMLIVEAFSRAGLVNRRFLPPLSEVLVQAALIWGDPEFWVDIVATLSAFVLGILIATLIAVPVGTALGLVRPAYMATSAIIELMRAIPPVALLPLVILLAGIGLEMKLILVVFAAAWPILFNTMYGVRDVDVQAKEMAKTFGTTELGIVRRITLPAASPFIAAGIRIASTLALLVVVTIEMVAGGTRGLGAFIGNAAALNRPDLVFAGVIIAGVLGLTVNLVLGAIERKWFFWQQTNRGAA